MTEKEINALALKVENVLDGAKLTGEEYRRGMEGVSELWKLALLALPSAKPAEPTDQEINEAIAKAQGWTRGWIGVGDHPNYYRKPDGSRIEVADYQPTTNLTQALEALQNLPNSIAHGISTYFDADEGRVEYDFGSHGWTTKPEGAARVITKLLYDRIWKGDE